MSEDQEELDAGNDLFDGVERRKDRERPAKSTDVTPQERPTGILTQTDREYLYGCKDYASPSTDANRRQDIRKRVRNGIEDFGLLVFGLPEGERKKLFSETEDDQDLYESLQFLIAFAYQGLGTDQLEFEHCLEQGIFWAENNENAFEKAGRTSEIDISLSIEHTHDVNALVGRLEDGDDSLTKSEIGAVAKAGRLKPEHLEQVTDDSSDIPGLSLNLWN